MKHFILNRLPLLLSGSALLLALLLLLVVGPVGRPAPVAAQTFSGLPSDGRINVVAHFGGDALYCVDGDFMPTYQYSDLGAGGIRLLNQNGAQLWFVPASEIAPKVAEAQTNGGQGVLIGQGQGTYGPTTLYVYIDSTGNIRFSFTGYDEWGKTNTLEWTSCQPVGPAPSPGTHSEPLCSARAVAEQIQDAIDSNSSIEEVYTTCAQSICPDVDSDIDFITCICEVLHDDSTICV